MGKKAAKKAKGKDQEEEENTPQGIQKVEIDAEQDKIRQEELKNGVDTAAMSTWIDPSAKIDIAPTKNWVRPGRGKKEKNKKKPRAEEEAACQEAGQEGKTRREEEEEAC